MKRIVTDQGDRIGEWVYGRMGAEWTPRRGTAIGLVDENDEILGGMVVENWNGDNCFLHFAGNDDPRWASPRFAHFCFNYIFNTLGCKRCTGMVESTNTHVRDIDERLGFQVEALLLGAGQGCDILIYRMFKEECKWIKQEVNHGK